MLATVEGAGSPSAVCWGSIPGPGPAMVMPCWAGGIEAKRGVHADKAEDWAKAEGRGARAGIPGVGRATVGVLGKQSEGRGGLAGNLDMGETRAGERVGVGIVGEG